MTQSTDTPKPISLDEEDREVLEGVQFFLAHGRTPDQILGMTHPSRRPLIARYLVQQGEVLRSEFRSEKEAEAFWAHIKEDAAIELAGISGFDMAQVPDPGERRAFHDLCPFDCPDR